MKKNVNIVTEYDGNKVIIISDIRFKGKTREEWEEVEEYLKEYIGTCYEIAESADKIYIGKEFPDEFVHGKDKTVFTWAKCKS